MKEVITFTLLVVAIGLFSVFIFLHKDKKVLKQIKENWKAVKRDFAPGEVVRVKGQYQDLTIESVEVYKRTAEELQDTIKYPSGEIATDVHVVWFDYDGNCFRNTFDSELLEIKL